MKLSRLFSICMVVLCVYTMTFSMPFAGETQKVFSIGDVAEERRPFDFSNKFYRENGVESVFILDRRTGQDKFSVVDYINSNEHRNVRITETLPAYSAEGKPMYFNSYGDIFRNAFTKDRGGENASEVANYYPIYTFPSAKIAGSDRQAVLIETDDDYFEKNPLGLSVVVLVEFSDRAFTPEGQRILEQLLRKNGASLDGTPIIRTLKEVGDLTRQNLITQEIQGLYEDNAQPPIMIAKVLEDPTNGTIAPDAFLTTVTDRHGKYLEAEEIFVKHFECLRVMNNWCTE